MELPTHPITSFFNISAWQLFYNLQSCLQVSFSGGAVDNKRLWNSFWQGINPSPKLVIKSPTCWSITALINSSPKCWWWLRNACITEMANNAAEIKQFCHRNIIFVTELIKLSPKGPNPSPKFNPVSPVAFKSEIRYNLWYIVYFECIFKQSLR